MKFTLEMIGIMRKPLGEGPVEVDVPPGTTVRAFMEERLGYRPEQVGLLTYLMNGKRVRPEASILDGCTLKVLMALGGG